MLARDRFTLSAELLVSQIIFKLRSKLKSFLSAFTAAWYIGPRIGRFDKGTEPPPLGDPMSICIGCFILWWSWIGFNAGSSFGVTNGKWEFAARAGAGTTLATMSGGMTAILFSLWRHKGKVDVYEVVSGILAALGS